jgi:hypothetical protein
MTARYPRGVLGLPPRRPEPNRMRTALRWVKKALWASSVFSRQSTQLHGIMNEENRKMLCSSNISGGMSS